MRLLIDIYDARKYTNAFIEYLEEIQEVSPLELSLLGWLSDDEVKEFAEYNYDIEFIEEEEDEEEEW